MLVDRASNILYHHTSPLSVQFADTYLYPWYTLDDERKIARVRVNARMIM